MPLAPLVHYTPLSSKKSTPNKCYKIGIETYQLVYNKEHSLRSLSTRSNIIGYDPMRKKWRLTIINNVLDPYTGRQTGVGGAIFTLSDDEVDMSDPGALPKKGTWRNGDGDTLTGTRVSCPH